MGWGVFVSEMKKKMQGLWEEENLNEVYSANLFYNNAFEIAEVRGAGPEAKWGKLGPLIYMLL